MTIYFYSTRDAYGCFSNFSRHGFELDNFWWMTSEHYFQAQKFVSTDVIWFDKIREVGSPKEAAKMGRSAERIWLRQRAIASFKARLGRS